MFLSIIHLKLKVLLTDDVVSFEQRDPGLYVEKQIIILSSHKTETDQPLHLTSTAVRQNSSPTFFPQTQDQNQSGSDDKFEIICYNKCHQ